MRVILFTDIPVWVRPLAGKLEARGAEVVTAAAVEDVPDDGLIVNRISTLLFRKQPEMGADFLAALEGWEREGRAMVNGPRVLALGVSKLAQAGFFEDAALATPRTMRAEPGKRALPGRRVLVKPGAGGFGKDIFELDGDRAVPPLRGGDAVEWVEQEHVAPVDGAVHRVEFVGDTILYDACSGIRTQDYNYCLANTEAEVELRPEAEMLPLAASQARMVARKAGMELGAVEYLVGEGRVPHFIDLNPVSSLHPGAVTMLGADPLDLTAEFLLRRAGASTGEVPQ